MAAHKFTRKQVETAVEVLSKSSMIQAWVLGELRAYGLTPDSPEGRKFIEEKSREIARRMLR